MMPANIGSDVLHCVLLSLQVEFTAMREQYMRGGEGFIICYSITDRHSFLEAEEYRNLILKVRAKREHRNVDAFLI